MVLKVTVIFENEYASSKSPTEFITGLFKRLEPDLKVLKLKVKQE